MKELKQIGFIVFILMITSFGYAQNETYFEEGNDLYNDGKFAEAVEKYEEIISNGEHSADLYYNLGNAHYKLNNIAPSIYYFEKALQLRPNDREITNNIAFARNMTIDAIEPVPEVGFQKMLNNVTKLLSFENWSKLAIFLMFSFVVLFLLYYFSKSTLKKRILFFGSLSLLVFVGLSVLMAFQSYSLFVKDKPAIVFSQEAQVKSEPNLRGTLVFTLHEGTKVQILETVEDWNKIKIADGKTGWITTDNLKMLNPDKS
ncbi:SH3 domain-containing protein [Flavobacteriaceae bacterium MAR_2010_188]|nr:SH3 domain-containing protein [Flavobacteriaceae bacterium MAR_2010_188]